MQRVPLFIGRWKPGFAIFFIRTGDSPLFRQIGGVQTSKSRENPPSRGRSPASRGTNAEGNAEGASARDLSARHLIPVLEIGPHEDFSPSDRGQHRSAHRRPDGRLGPAEDALRRRLWRLVREDHPRRGDPDLREGERRQGRIRRRQLHRHAGKAPGAEGQPADRRRHRRRRPDVPGDPARLLRQARGPAGRRSLRHRALQGRSRRRDRPRRHRPDVQHEGVRREGLGAADLVERPEGHEVRQAARHPADQQHLRSRSAGDVGEDERRRRVQRRLRASRSSRTRSIRTCSPTSRRRAR